MEINLVCGWQELKGQRYPIIYDFSNDFDGMPVEMYCGADLDKEGMTPFGAYGGRFYEGTLEYFNVCKDGLWQKNYGFCSKDVVHDYNGDAKTKLFRLCEKYEFIFWSPNPHNLHDINPIFIVLNMRMHCGFRLKHIRSYGEEERIYTGRIEHDGKDYYFYSDDREHDCKKDLSLERFLIPLEIEYKKWFEYRLEYRDKNNSWH